MKIQVDDYLRNRRSFTKDEKQFLLDYVADRCVHCGVKLDIHSISVEHVFPLSKGGLNDILNLVPLCEKCNETKSNDIYTFDSYFNMMYFKSIEVASSKTTCMQTAANKATSPTHTLFLVSFL